MNSAASILVVEDEPAIMELLRVNLADAGYDVRTVADAEAAEREIARAVPTLVLLDWMLPRKSGLAFARLDTVAAAQIVRDDKAIDDEFRAACASS